MNAYQRLSLRDVVLNYGYGLHGWNVLFTRFEGGLKVRFLFFFSFPFTVSQPQMALTHNI